MRLYTIDDEVRIRTTRALRDWTTAGLLSAEQAVALAPDLSTNLRRTGVMLRLGLAAFTVIAGAAAIGLVFVIGHFDADIAVSVVTALLGAGSLAAAGRIVRRYRLYRYGVEEVLAMAGVGLFGVSAGMLGGELFRGHARGAPWALGMTMVTLVAGAVYRRFGYQYAAIVALYAAALLPLGLFDAGPEGARAFAAVVCAAGFAVATRVRHRSGDDITTADAEVVRAAAAVGAYLALNVVLSSGPFGHDERATFRWITWVVTWLLPFAVGRVAVVERDPLLWRVAIAGVLASLATNKPYWGWARQPWDPMLLGLLLVGVALALRRWLSSGEGEARHGVTARPLLESDAATIQLISLASAATPATPDPPAAAEPTAPSFSGGRSGGGGAGSRF